MRNLTDGRKLALLPELTITTAVNATAGTVFSGLAGIKYLIVYAKMKVGTGGSSIKAYVQTSLDGGATWIDIMSFAFANTAGTKVSAVSMAVALAAATVASDGALTDDTIVNGLLGDRIRVKYVTTGTYSGGTSLTVSAVAKGA
ncbi:MAG: hypothetical protein ABFD60_01655 [Bryobacteraceae bacterium]